MIASAIAFDEENINFDKGVHNYLAQEGLKLIVNPDRSIAILRQDSVTPPRLHEDKKAGRLDIFKSDVAKYQSYAIRNAISQNNISELNRQLALIREEHRPKEINLSGVDFTGLDLTGIDFSEAELARDRRRHGIDCSARRQRHEIQETGISIGVVAQ